MSYVLEGLAGIFLVRALWGLALMLLGGLHADTATFNGFWITIPRGVRSSLSERELEAVRLHEEGHRFHGHVWRNYWRWLVLDPVDAKVRQKQEMEADDYAEARGYGADLATSLIRRGAGGFNRARAVRLQIRARARGTP